MPLNIDFQQIFLHLLNFTILFGALYFLLYSPVKDFMAKRAAYYEDMDNQAKQTLEDAGQVRADYEQKLENAAEEIRRRSEQAQQAAMESAGQQLQAAREEAARIVERARSEAEAEREVSGMVMAAVEKLVLADTASAYDQFLEAAGEERADV